MIGQSDNERNRSAVPLSSTRNGPPSGHGPDRPVFKRQWIPVVLTVVGLVLFVATCNVVTLSRRPPPNPGSEWMALIDQGRWTDARRAMCADATVADLAADFDAGIDSYHVDWTSADYGARTIDGLVTIDGEDLLLSIAIDHGGDDWRVCRYGLEPIG